MPGPGGMLGFGLKKYTTKHVAICFTSMTIGNLGCVAPHTKILGVGQPKVDFCTIMQIIMRVHTILTVNVWVLLNVVFRFTLAERAKNFGFYSS